MKWYEQNYVNRRDWLIENAAMLGLSAGEFMIATIIDFMNEHRIPVSLETLAKRSGMSTKQVNDIVSILCTKKYMDIKASSKEIRFILDGMFQAEVRKEERILDRSLIDIFESEFNRTLNNSEMTKISDMGRTYDKKLILYALQSASAMQKHSVQFVESTLVKWTSQGITAEIIETKR